MTILWEARTWDPCDSKLTQELQGASPLCPALPLCFPSVLGRRKGVAMTQTFLLFNVDMHRYAYKDRKIVYCTRFSPWFTYEKKYTGSKARALSFNDTHIFCSALNLPKCTVMTILPQSGFTYLGVQAMAQYPLYGFLQSGIKKGIKE